MQKKIKQAKKYLEWGKPNQAIAELKPTLNSSRIQKEFKWVPNHLMGIALSLQGEMESAIRYLKKAVKHGSEQPETYYLLSESYFKLEIFEKAEEFGEKAVTLNNDFLKGWMKLGEIYQSQAKLDEALQCYKEANRIDPKNAGVAFNIGRIYRDQGDLDQAMKLFDITLQVDEDHLKAMLERADLYKNNGRLDDALEKLDNAEEKHGSHPAIIVSKAEVSRAQGDYDQAIDLYEEILEDFPENGPLFINYALCLQEVGRFDKSEKHYREAISLMDDPRNAISNYLMGLHYNPENSREYIFNEHVTYCKEFVPEEGVEELSAVMDNPNRKLRVGFISGGFRRHPVGWMIAGALEQLKGEDFELVCYTTDNRFDFITRRIHRNVDQWKSIIGYSDTVIKNIILDDELDILVDLTGHAADNCMNVMGHKPAPILVKWVGGLFNTTGLEAFDYLITDNHESPKGEEQYYTEKLVRMPDDYIVYAPPAYAPDVGMLPAPKNEYITFGCFNNPTKVNEQVLHHWADIMQQVPESHLYLKSKQYDTASFREQILEVMGSEGIAKERIEFEGRTGHEEHLAAYNKIDIALDPWPYSGGLTTCEALYMGVPVITMPGPTFAGRHSTTHLINAGLEQWVTDSWEEYTEKAVALANDQDQLEEWRNKLRDQLLDSPVCDGKRFGAHLSVAFREMWKQRKEGYKTNDNKWQDHISIEPLSDEQLNKLTGGPDETPLITIKDMDKEKADNNNEIEEENNKMIDTEEVTQNGRTNKNGTSNVSIGLSDNEDFHVETKDGLTICVPDDLDVLTTYVMLEQEEWFEPELDFLRQYVQPEMHVVDAGACFGGYALPLAKKVGQSGQVTAFEPSDESRNYLEKSKVQNEFSQVAIIGRALSSETGTFPFQKEETPELNRVHEEGEQEVLGTALDTWWDFAGQPHVDVIKLDINGMEVDALKGAKELLADAKPVVVSSIGEGEPDFEKLHQEFSEQDYKLFEYIPGPGLLADHDPEAGVDPYLMNVICIHESKVEEFEDNGWVFDESVDIEAADVRGWKGYIEQLPWAKSQLKKWERQIDSTEHEEYLQALSLACAAEQMEITEQDSKSRSRKGAMMLTAAEKLISLFNSGNAGIAAGLTYVRVMSQLGKIMQSVEMAKQLMETVNSGRDISLDLPFLPPLPEQDTTNIQTDFSKWLTVRVVETWITLQNPTTYMVGEQEQGMLEALEENPETNDVFKKSICLVNRGNKKVIDSKRNKWFWNENDSTKKEVEKSLISVDFWNGKFTPEKAQKVVAFTETFFEDQLEKEQLKRIVQETAYRLSQASDDNVVFFIQVQALLALNDHGIKADISKELRDVLVDKEWEHKNVLYNYWFDKVEYRESVDDPEVSAIIISNRFKEKTIKNLKRLNEQLEGLGEIIFVNNGEKDKVFAPLQEYVDTYIRLKGNSGAYLARNFGALFAKGDYLLFVDDDGIPDEGMVQAHLDAHNENDIIVSRGVCYSDNPEGDPWHYNLGQSVKPAVTFLEGNSMYQQKEFYEVEGWGDYILFGHGGMEMSYRLLSIDADKKKQVYIPNARLNHDYKKKGMRQDEKVKKQTYSSYLLRSKHDGLNQVIKKWPQSFDRKKNENYVMENTTYNLPSDVKIISFNEKSSSRNFEIAIPEDEVHRIYNIFKRNEYSLPKNLKMNNDLTVVDVGANVGVFALYSQLLANNVDVYCFEPNPQVLPLLKRNTNNLSNIKIFNKALGESDGSLVLHQHPLNTGQASTTYSLDGAKKVEVDVRNSGDMLKNEIKDTIDILKIDTEGAEVSILKGMRDLLPQTKIVMAEYHTEDDRKEIEKLLNNFLLYSAEVQDMRGVGTVKYANLNFFEETN